MDKKNKTDKTNSESLEAINRALNRISNTKSNPQKTSPDYNNTLGQSNFQPNSYNSDQKQEKLDHLQTDKKELMSYKAYQEENNSDEEGDDEDDDERFIKKDDEFSLSQANEEIAGQIISDLEEHHENLKGIRPNTNQLRSLSSEHGGLEVETVTHDKGGDSISEDVWDERSEEIDQAAEQEDDRLSDTSTSSLRQSFIGTKKHKKNRDRKRGKKHDEIAEEMESGGLSLLDVRKEDKASSHVDRLNSQRSSGSKGGGITLF